MNAELQLPGEADCYRSGFVIADRYRLLRRLEEGGMSWVWLAHHIPLDVPIAIKIAKAVSRKACEHARREGRLTAALHHPSIVTVLDTGETEWGDPFVVMEHLEGCSLADALTRERRMSARDAVKLMLPILDALALCHERGILHGDVKPANVFLAREQGRTRAKLLDFGIARDLSSREPVTELSGTPGYMAPEQVGEGRVDQRADVWAVCATLYEAVVGRRAVQGRSCAELLASTLAPEITPLPEREPGNARLWAVLERGLRVVPHERFATVRALADALLSWQQEQRDGLVRSSAPLGDAPVFDERALCDTVVAVPRVKRKRRVVQRHEWLAPPRVKRRSVVPQVVLTAASLVLAVLVTQGPAGAQLAHVVPGLSGVQSALAAVPAARRRASEIRTAAQRDTGVEPAPAPLPECIAVRAEARYRSFGYDHIVVVDNACSTAAVCDVATNVNPTAVRVLVPAGQAVEVLAFRGSPARSFVPDVRCQLVAGG